MEIAKDISEWLGNCPTETETMQEFNDSIWVRVFAPWEEDDE